MKSLQQANSLFEQVISRIPPETAATFSASQLEALSEALHQLQWKNHPVDIRMSVPVLWKRFYIVFLMGPERRSIRRLRSENSHYPLGAMMSVVASAMLLSAMATLSLLPLLDPKANAEDFQQSQFHPTGIPWLQSEAACENTGRLWQDGTCIDTEHSPNF